MADVITTKTSTFRTWSCSDAFEAFASQNDIRAGVLRIHSATGVLPELRKWPNLLAQGGQAIPSERRGFNRLRFFNPVAGRD